MLDQLERFADNNKAKGWLQLKGGVSDEVWSYRVPGTSYNYNCSMAYFLLSSETNPDQPLYCQGSRRVDFSGITEQCVRKLADQQSVN